MGKILIYPLTESVGGVEEYEMNFIRYSSADHRQLYGYVILGNQSPYKLELEEKHIKNYTLPTRQKLVRSILSTYKLFKKLRVEYDTLYFNTSALGYVVPYILGILFGYKIVLHSHLDGSKIASPLKKIVQRTNYSIIKKHISLKLACSMQAANWMFDGDIDKVIIIPNAINLQRFKYKPEVRDRIRKELKLKDSIVIGNISRLTRVKNQEFLVRLVEYMLSQGHNVKLLLVGDGEDRRKLEKLVLDKNLSDKIIFYGKTNSPENVMNAMDCIVLPSFTEGFPISIIEAQAAGLKCLLSDTITREVNVTGNVEYLSLDDPLFEWSNKILGFNYKRNDNYTKLKADGYDVNELEQYVYNLIESAR